MNAIPHSELFNTLLALAAITAASLLGSVSFAFGRRLQSILPYVVAVATGFLIATSLMDLLPEAIDRLHDVRPATFLFLLGLLGSFLLERFLTLRSLQANKVGMPLASNVVLGGAVHSFVDGVAIAAAFAVSHETGIATTLAVFFHEVPHHVVDVGLLIYSGMSRSRATCVNLLATSGCALGGVLVLVSGLRSPAFTVMVLPIAAANFLYIAVAILMPEMQREKSRRRSFLQATLLLIAVGGMTALGHWRL